MPANLYGVANPNPALTGLNTIGGVDISCPAGTETNLCSGPATLPTSQGWYYPYAQGWVTVTFGATVPTALTLSLRLNNGADLASFPFNTLTFVASGTIIYPVAFTAPGTIIAYPIGVFNFQTTCLVNAQPVTVRFVGTNFYIQWLRATDQ